MRNDTQSGHSKLRPFIEPIRGQLAKFHPTFKILKREWDYSALAISARPFRRGGGASINQVRSEIRGTMGSRCRMHRSMQAAKPRSSAWQVLSNSIHGSSERSGKEIFRYSVCAPQSILVWGLTSNLTESFQDLRVSDQRHPSSLLIRGL